MTVQQFFGVILSPGRTLPELAKDEANRRDFMPGIRFIVIFSVVVACLDLGLAGLAWLVGSLWAGGAGMAMGMLAAFTLSPFAAVLMLAQILALALLSQFAFAFTVDFIQQKLFNHKGGQQRPLFNLAVQATLPFGVAVTVPMLLAGLAIAAGGFMMILAYLLYLVVFVAYLAILVAVIANLSRVMEIVYGDSALGRRLVSIFLGWIGSSVTGGLAFLLLMLAFTPLWAMDPFQGLAQNAMNKMAMASLGGQDSQSPSQDQQFTKATQAFLKLLSATAQVQISAQQTAQARSGQPFSSAAQPQAAPSPRSEPSQQASQNQASFEARLKAAERASQAAKRKRKEAYQAKQADWQLRSAETSFKSVPGEAGTNLVGTWQAGAGEWTFNADGTFRHSGTGTPSSGKYKIYGTGPQSQLILLVLKPSPAMKLDIYTLDQTGLHINDMDANTNETFTKQ